MIMMVMTMMKLPTLVCTGIQMQQLFTKHELVFHKIARFQNARKLGENTGWVLGIGVKGGGRMGGGEVAPSAGPPGLPRKLLTLQMQNRACWRIRS